MGACGLETCYILPHTAVFLFEYAASKAPWKLSPVLWTAASPTHTTANELICFNLKEGNKKMQDFLSLNVPFTPGNNSSSNSYQRGQSLIFRQPLILSTRFRQWSLPRDKLCNMNFSTLSCTSNSPARVSYRLLPINSVVLYLQISSIRISIQWPELEPGLILRLGFRRGCAPPPQYC